MNSEQVKELSDSIKQLPTKKDLDGIYDRLKEFFSYEISLRDEKIIELENQVRSLQDQNKRIKKEHDVSIQVLKENIDKLNEKFTKPKEIEPTNLEENTV